MFGGTTLSHDKEWIQSSIDFATDGFIGAQALKKYPEFLKPFIARFVPAIQKIKSHYDAAERAAIPLLKERAANGTIAPDLLYWMAEDAKGDEKDLAFLAGILLKVSFAAIHTSAAAPTQLLYDLCDMPEYIEPLRSEIDQNLDGNGLLGRQGFQGLTKLDSVMKESQRFNPLLLGKFGICNRQRPPKSRCILTCHSHIRASHYCRLHSPRRSEDTRPHNNRRTRPRHLNGPRDLPRT
jgi:cytochrome P450